MPPRKRKSVAPDPIDKPLNPNLAAGRAKTAPVIVKSTWLRDTTERVLFTFAQAFLGVFGATQIVDATSGHLDVSLARMALSAGIAAVLALVKAAVAAKVAGTVSPASLAPTPAPEPVDAEAGYSLLELLVGIVIIALAVIGLLALLGTHVVR